MVNEPPNVYNATRGNTLPELPTGYLPDHLLHSEANSLLKLVAEYYEQGCQNVATERLREGLNEVFRRVEERAYNENRTQIIV